MDRTTLFLSPLFLLLLSPFLLSPLSSFPPFLLLLQYHHNCQNEALKKFNGKHLVELVKRVKSFLDVTPPVTRKSIHAVTSHDNVTPSYYHPRTTHKSSKLHFMTYTSY